MAARLGGGGAKKNKKIMMEFRRKISTKLHDLPFPVSEVHSLLNAAGTSAAVCQANVKLENFSNAWQQEKQREAQAWRDFFFLLFGQQRSLKTPGSCDLTAGPRRNSTCLPGWLALKPAASQLNALTKVLNEQDGRT